jgi:hypothetical protein
MDTNKHECKPLLFFVFIRVHSWTSFFCWRAWRVTGCYRTLPGVTAHPEDEERTHGGLGNLRGRLFGKRFCGISRNPEVGP